MLRISRALELGGVEGNECVVRKRTRPSRTLEEGEKEGIEHERRKKS